MQLHTKNGHWNVWWSIPLKGGGFSWSSSRQQRWITVTSSWAARAERGWGFDSRRSGPDRRCPPERTWPPSFPAPRRSYSSPAATQTQMLQLDQHSASSSKLHTNSEQDVCVHKFTDAHMLLNKYGQFSSLLSDIIFPQCNTQRSWWLLSVTENKHVISCWYKLVKYVDLSALTGF